jgi:hypothetical protein
VRLKSIFSEFPIPYAVESNPRPERHVLIFDAIRSRGHRPSRGDDRVDGSTTSDLDADEPTVALDAVPPGPLPRIADYWPDAPHRMQPEADYYPDTVEDSRPVTPAYPSPPRVIGAPPPPRRRRGLRIVLATLAVVVFLGGAVLVLARMVLGSGGPAPAISAAPPTAIAAPAPSAPVSIEPAPADPPATTPPASTAALPFTSGTFELASNVTELHVAIADLGAAPVEASTPGGSGLKLRTTVGDGVAKLFADPTGAKGSGRVDVRLNRKVTWSVRMTGGVRDGTFVLTGGAIRRIDLTGGAARLTMTLDTPEETLPIRMTGGVNTWRITTATEVPVSVLLRKGAGEVALNGHRTRSIKRNTNVREGAVGNGGIGIDCVAGVGTLTVAPASP